MDLWALAEVRFSQHGSRCRMWIPPEVNDPVVLPHPTRKRVGYLGAVRLRDGRFVFAREADRFNAHTCWAFLKQLRAHSRLRRGRVVVISDHARYHHATVHAAWRENHHEPFPLDDLPPYSPELNPIERVWKRVRT